MEKVRYKVKAKKTNRLAYNPIPKEYMFKGSYERGGTRTVSPIGKELDKLKLEEIECPCCGEKRLRNKEYDVDCCHEPNFLVGCDNCDWDLPQPAINDCGDAIGAFRDWLEAFTLMGKPRERLNEDVSIYFYPDGSYRDKVIKSLHEEFPEYYEKNKKKLAKFDDEYLDSLWDKILNNNN